MKIKPKMAKLVEGCMLWEEEKPIKTLTECPRLKNQNYENQTENGEARGRVYALGGGEADQDPNATRSQILVTTINFNPPSQILDSQAEAIKEENVENEKSLWKNITGASYRTVEEHYRCVLQGHPKKLFDLSYRDDQRIPVYLTGITDAYNRRVLQRQDFSSPSSSPANSGIPSQFGFGDQVPIRDQILHHIGSGHVRLSKMSGQNPFLLLKAKDLRFGLLAGGMCSLQKIMLLRQSLVHLLLPLKVVVGLTEPIGQRQTPIVLISQLNTVVVNLFEPLQELNLS
nr:hypothetical protein [Tanacetum cinerariifolium]